MSTPVEYSLSYWKDRCNVTRKTLHRRLKAAEEAGFPSDGDFPNARKIDGVWIIPAEDMTNADRIEIKPEPETSAASVAQTGPVVDHLIAEAEDLRSRLSETQAERDKLEAKVEEYRSKYEGALEQMAFRSIESGDAAPATQSASEAPEEPSAPGTHGGAGTAVRSHLVAWISAIVALAAVVALIVVLVVAT